MSNKILIQKISAKIKKAPYDIEAYKDLFALCRNIEKEDFDLSHKTNADLRSLLVRNMKKSGNITEFFGLYKKTLLFDAPYSFDCYLLYLEIERKPEERFYQPRRKIMKQVVDALQDKTIIHNNKWTLCIPSEVSVRFSKFLEENGLRHIRFHDLRHTHASLLANEYDTNVMAIRERLGHSRASTTMNCYISGTSKQQLDGVEKLNIDLYRNDNNIVS
ncbi:MAG: tyrosine-type recombinase/integrase [Acutalibacteraceae bacterium]